MNSEPSVCKGCFLVSVSQYKVIWLPKVGESQVKTMYMWGSGMSLENQLIGWGVYKKEMGCVVGVDHHQKMLEKHSSKSLGQSPRSPGFHKGLFIHRTNFLGPY